MHICIEVYNACTEVVVGKVRGHCTMNIFVYAYDNGIQHACMVIAH